MRVIQAVLSGTSRALYWVSGIGLLVLMLVTTADVAMRIFYEPIEGIYDITLFLAGIIVSFAIPYSTLKQIHVKMDFFIDLLPRGANLRKIFGALVYSMGALFFLLVGWNVIGYGIRLHETGEVSHTIHLPLAPLVICMGVVCLFNCLVLLYRLFAVFAAKEEA